jgi:ATP-dependent Clp protease ATP-binding subunit ClpA
MLNHNYIGTEHLLLGLIHEDEGVAAIALASLDISLDAVRRKIEEVIGQGQSAPAGHIPFTPRAKKVLELSLREALQLGHNYIGTEHILLGLIREGEGVAAQVLQELGADLNRVRQTVIQLLSGYTGTEAAAETFEEPKQRWTFRPRPRSRRGGGDGPQCPTCQAPLEGSTGVKRVTATGDEEEREVTIAYCRSCGRALGTVQ